MASIQIRGTDTLDALGRARIVRTLRFLLVLAVVGAAYPVAREGDLSWRFWAAAAILFFSNLVLPLVREDLFRSTRLPAAVFILDVAMIGFVFYELGEKTGEFYLLFALSLLVAAVSRGLGGVLAATTLAGVLYGLLAAHGKVGLSPCSMDFLTRVAFFFSFTLFIAHLAAEADRARRVVRVSEAAAEVSRRSLEGVADLLPVPVILMDGDGRLLLFNRACERLTGYARGVLLGRDPVDLLVPEIWRESVRNRFRHPEAAGFDVAHEIPWRTKAGTERQIEWHFAAIPSESGVRPFVLGLGRDVTASLRLTPRWAEARKMDALGRMAAGLAADLNDLMAAITGFVHLGLRNLDGGQPVRPALDEVLRIAERGAELVRRLQSVGGSPEAAPVVMDLNAHVNGLSRALQRMLGESVTLRLVAGPEPLRVKADPGLIEQAILNLAARAREAMPGGGALTIETAGIPMDSAEIHRLPGDRPGPYAVLVMTDTGRTMDDETRSRLFEPFAAGRGGDGLAGLGLSLVYGIVRQAGGAIDVQPVPGGGSRFRILLPRLE